MSAESDVIGHLACKIAKAMGADVTVFTRTKEKLEEAGKFGITAVLEKDKDALEGLKASFDFILSTIPEKHDINPFIELLKRDCTVCIVGALVVRPKSFSACFNVHSPCSCVLLATGVRDHLPAIEGAENAVTRSVLRVCPICDAFEAIDQRIAIIGDGAMAEREVEFLRNYSDRVTVLDIGPSNGIRKPPPTGAGGFERISINLSQLEIKKNRLTVASANGERNFDVAYLALGSTPQHGLARSLSAQCDERDALMVNAHQMTSVPRLYAAGDVVRGLNQVVVAAAEGAVAATDIHNQLRADQRMRMIPTAECGYR